MVLLLILKSLPSLIQVLRLLSFDRNKSLVRSRIFHNSSLRSSNLPTGQASCGRTSTEPNFLCSRMSIHAMLLSVWSRHMCRMSMRMGRPFSSRWRIECNTHAVSSSSHGISNYSSAHIPSITIGPRLSQTRLPSANCRRSTCGGESYPAYHFCHSAG